MAYTKLFSSIVTSTIWSEDDKTRIVWITMLAIADKNGEVQASIPGLARVAGVSVDDAQAAITKFLSPDPYSRTPDDQGRRIEPIPGGWALLNHAKYRAMASKDESRASNAERQRRFREKEKRNADRNAIVTPSNGLITHHRDIAEAQAEADPLFSIEEPSGSSHPAKAGKAWEPDENQKRINSIFRRRDTTQWDDKEIRAYRKLRIEESDLEAVESYYRADHKEGEGWKRMTVQTLLNNWNGEVDKATKYALASQPRAFDPERPF